MGTWREVWNAGSQLRAVYRRHPPPFCGWLALNSSIIGNWEEMVTGKSPAPDTGVLQALCLVPRPESTSQNSPQLMVMVYTLQWCTLCVFPSL